jgi:hypothetical protein
VRYSWTYDTERVKHVNGLMGAPIFFHLSHSTYGTLSYSESVELGGIKLQHDNAVFRKKADSTIGFSAKFSTFYVLGPSSEN